jgi:hypothetical protein
MHLYHLVVSVNASAKCRTGIPGDHSAMTMRVAQFDSGRDVSLASALGEEAGAASSSHLPEVDINDEWGTVSRYNAVEEPVHSVVGTSDAVAGCSDAVSYPSSPWPGPKGIPAQPGIPGKPGTARFIPIAQLEQMLALPGAAHPVVPHPGASPDGAGAGGGKDGKRRDSPRRRDGKPVVEEEGDTLPPLPRSDEINSMDDPVAKLEDLLLRPGAVHPTMPPPDYADKQLERLKGNDPAAFAARMQRASFKRKSLNNSVSVCRGFPPRVGRVWVCGRRQGLLSCYLVK